MSLELRLCFDALSEKSGIFLIDAFAWTQNVCSSKVAISVTFVSFEYRPSEIIGVVEVTHLCVNGGRKNSICAKY